MHSGLGLASGQRGRIHEKAKDAENRRILHDAGLKHSIQEKSSKINEANSTQCSTSDIEKDTHRRPGRHKKNKRTIDPEAAEKKILASTGRAPEHIQESLLHSMTASDIGVQALEYLEHIETIRTKSGRLQGGLSGELKKRKVCLEEMIRALQFKAESKNDPEFLKHKLEELMEEIKKRKKEEERYKREMGEFRKIIKEMKQDNKEMREELRRLKEEVKKSSEERTMDKEENRTGVKRGRVFTNTNRHAKNM